jgi:large repetitive protein
MKKVFACIIIVSSCMVVTAQNIGIGTTTPAASAALDVTSTSKGFLPPRMTTVQRNAISSPAAGLIIYNTDCNTFNYWNGTAWVPFPGNANAPATPGSITGSLTPCQNATGIAYSIAPVAGATSYNWTVPPGTTVASGQGTASITLNFGTTNGNVCVTASNACGTSAASCITITLSTIAPQPSIITGTTLLCQGDNAVAYSVVNVAGLAYIWSYSGTGYTQASGGITNSITANFSTFATSGALTVIPNNACGNGTAQTLAITVSAAPTTANAGADINPACGVTIATLAGNTPSVGTGYWSVVSGTATITTPGSPTSGVTGLLQGSTVTLRWTISNSPPCAASTDDVLITTTCCTLPNITAGSTTFGTSAPCNSSSNVITLNKPAGVASGNVLIAAITLGNSAITAPSGWILISSFTNWSPSYVYYKVAGASEPANYTWTFSAGEIASGVITNFTGTFCNSPVGVRSVEVTSVYTASSVTTSTANQMLVAIFSGGGGLTTWSTPAGMTADYSGGQNCRSTAIFHGIQAAAGASGPKTGTPSIAAGNGIAYLIALQ